MGTGALVSSFGSGQLSGSSGQGGIAVNGQTGLIYVVNGEARCMCSAAMRRL